MAILTWFYFAAAFALIALVLRGLAKRRGRWAPGVGASGAVYELLNEDKRKAIEIILEERAEYTDPETKDGDLSSQGRPRSPGGVTRTD